MNNQLNQNNNQIVGYDPQTGQPIYANHNQSIRENNNMYQQQYDEQDNIIPEQLKKCRKTLHNDSMVLLIISIIVMIFGIIFVESDESLAMDLFMESLLYFIFLIILVANKRTTKKFIGVLSIIISSFMILFGIINHSLFDIMYFILGIFYIIHSIKYLKSIKGYIPTKRVQEKLKIDKLKKISLILIIMCIVYPILSAILSDFASDNMYYFFHKSISIVLFICALTSLILNIILFIKKRKSPTLYICSIFSILITLFAGNYAFYAAEDLLSYYTSYDSEEDKEFLMYTTEDNVNRVIEGSLGNCINEPTPNTNEELLINKEIYESCIDLYNKKIKEYKADPETSKLYEDEEEWSNVYEKNEKKGYVCDGYTVLRRFYSEQECMEVVNDSISCMGYDKDYKIGQTHSSTFIKCTGKYDYQTEGFNEEKLKESKNNEEKYTVVGFKNLEYNFNQQVIKEFSFDLKYHGIDYKVISKTEYENELDNELNEFSVFDKEIYDNYSCDGYVELNYNKATNEVNGNPYIRCTGKYNYQTEGFDSGKLK